MMADVVPTDDSAAAMPDTAAARPGVWRRLRRFVLLGVVPALVVAGAAFAYLQTGRYVSTDNAYVKGHVVNVAPEVAGPIAAVLVEEFQRVDAGAVLFRVRAEPYRIAVAHAEAALAQAATDIDADKQAYRRALAQIEQNRSTAEFARTQYERQVRLRRSNLGSAEDLDTARYALDSALQQIKVTQQEAAELLARLDGNLDGARDSYPRYRQAQAEHQQALLDLQRTEIRAPVAGVVTNRPEPGDYAERGVAAMALVAEADMWIEANFKETQLTHITVGQPATFEIDTYPAQQWRGRVESVSEATGAEFALLPPQNATGNWVKIVQRIPVRIAIEHRSGQPPLRIGMSSTVTVDTGHERTWRDLVPRL